MKRECYRKKRSYAHNAGMLLKTHGVIGSTARRAGPAVRPCGLSRGAGSCRVTQGEPRRKSRPPLKRLAIAGKAR